jgi:hypothetical protein
VDSTAPFGRHGLTTARERYFAPVWIRIGSICDV